MSAPLILILGENGSGKSLYAEALVRRAPLARRLYVATMQPYGDEGRRRVEKHRAQRAGDGYETLEIPRYIGALPARPDTVVLLEDVSNLVANTLFDPVEPGGDSAALDEIERLRGRCGALVAVSVRMPDAEGFTDETKDYIQAMDRVNAALAARATAVAALRAGAPVVTKGALPW